MEAQYIHTALFNSFNTSFLYNVFVAVKGFPIEEAEI